MMRDIDVRQAVHTKLLREHHKNPETLVIDEFSINLGASRADIAVINGLLHGYELKSTKDTLERLPIQTTLYSAVMDKVTLVVADNHAEEAISLVPEWWGIKIAVQGPRGAVHIHHYRSDKYNVNIDPFVLAQLLWKNECLDLLDKRGLAKGVKSKPRYELWNIIAEKVLPDELRVEVRLALKRRKTWNI